MLDDAASAIHYTKHRARTSFAHSFGAGRHKMVRPWQDTDALTVSVWSTLVGCDN